MFLSALFLDQYALCCQCGSAGCHGHTQFCLEAGNHDRSWGYGGCWSKAALEREALASYVSEKDSFCPALAAIRFLTVETVKMLPVM